MKDSNFSPLLIGVTFKKRWTQNSPTDQFVASVPSLYSSGSTCVSSPPTFCRSQAASYLERSYGKQVGV